ncbi:MAG: DUF4192 domain-containing protein [Nocardioides sp.]
MTTETRTRTLTARSPADVIALAHMLLGFVPEESLVILGLGARTFVVRFDLPPTEALATVVEEVTTTVLRNGVRRAALVVFTADSGGGPAGEAMSVALKAAGVEVWCSIAADSGRWHCLGECVGRSCVDPDDDSACAGAYDAATHPFVLEAQVSGQGVLASRAELARRVAPVDERVRAVEQAVRQRHRPRQDKSQRRGPFGPDATPDPTPQQIADFLHQLARPAYEVELIAAHSRQTAGAWVPWWLLVLTSAPPAMVPRAAAWTAFACWLSGNGALAWCAVERCLESDPNHRMGGLVARLLAAGTPPDTWERAGAAKGLSGWS